MGQPTMDDVAAHAGVSRALVSLVMRESPRVSDQSRKKVLASANELGYRPNVWARNLASGQTNTIGVMLNDLHNPYFTELAEGVAAAAAEAGMELLITSGWQREAGELAAIETLLNMRTDGIVLGAARFSGEVFDDLARQTPTVAVANFDEPDSMDTVCNDEDHGSQLVVDHLTSLGHVRIAHIDGGNSPSGPERRLGFMNSMSERGLAPIVIDGDFNEHAGHDAASRLMNLKEPPTAIFAANDLSATGVLAHLRSIGARVPEDVAVVGYDDTLLAGLGALSLTTIHQPRQLFGQRATELLIERIGGRSEPKHEFIQPRLVTRSSTGPVLD
ncbi:MAG: DNA-binding LacI/PurR family transcriptional regulator [Verrucomicrobiales bacterium]|jgi:DNA-binding LacI/PurR family transcriptional regulator